MDDDDGFLITTIRCARQEFQQIVGQARMIQVEAQNIAEEVKRETEDVVTYLRQEENLLPRLGAIGLGGFAGYLLACRKGLIKKTLYSAAGAGLIAAVAYPNQAKEYTEEVMCEVKKYAVIGYHFLNGADVDWKKLEKIKPPCWSQNGGMQPLNDEKGKPQTAKDETGKEGDKLALTDKEKEKEKPPPDPCKDKLKAAEKSGPDDKRSYTERCRERGACGVPKKKPAVDGEKTVTQCDPDCTGPKRGGNRCGERLRRNDSESKSRTTPREMVPEKCQPPVKPPEESQPQQANRKCPVGCVPAPGSDPCKAGRTPDQSKPKEPKLDPCQPSGEIKDSSQPSGSTMDPCLPTGKARESPQTSGSTMDPCPSSGKAREPPQPSGSTVDPCLPSGKARESPQASGSTMDPFPSSGKTGVGPEPSGSIMDPFSPNGTTKDSQPDQPFEGATCRRKRRVIWRNQNQPDDARGQGSGVPLNSGKAGDRNTGPITGGVADGSRGHSTGSEQCIMNPCQSDNKPGSDGNQGPTARDPSDPCKSAIKKSSVTITYPNPPGSADSRVIMNPTDKKPCGGSSMPPKEVAMNSHHQQRPRIQREDCPPTQPRQASRYGSRRRREPQSQIDEP